MRFNYPILAVPAILAISGVPSPSLVIPDWRGFQRVHPKSSQIGVDFSDLASIGVGLSTHFVFLRVLCGLKYFLSHRQIVQAYFTFCSPLCQRQKVSNSFRFIVCHKSLNTSPRGLFRPMARSSINIRQGSCLSFSIRETVAWSVPTRSAYTVWLRPFAFRICRTRLPNRTAMSQNKLIKNFQCCSLE